MQKQYNVGLYLRLSVEDAANSQKRGKVNPFQNDSSSIENQRILLTEYVDIQGWNLIQPYIDDGYSGGTFDKRPAFQQMIKDAEAGIINLILCKDLSRFGRDYIETGRYTDEVFPSLGVRFIALMDNIDSEGNDDLLPFRSILNDYHLKDLSRKIKSVLKAKAEEGRLVGKAPYGFIKDPDRKNHLLVDESSADVVRRIFGMRAQGIGCASIAATLNNEGIPSPYTHRNKLAGIDKPPKSWVTCSIFEMLSNEVYIGHSVRFKTGYLSYKNRKVLDKPADEWIRAENVFPPIIDLEVWETVRRVADGAAKRRAAIVTQPYRKSPFSKLLRCADCGATLVHKKGYSKSRLTGESKTSHAYICGKFHRTGGATCSRHTIRESVLLSVVKEDIFRGLEALSVDENNLALEVQRRFKEGNADGIRWSLGEARQQQEQLASRLEELEALGMKLYEDRLGGVINIDTFKMLSERAEADKASVQAELEHLSEIISSEEQRASEITNIIPKLRDFLSLENVTHETLAELIDRIVVSESVGRSQNRTHDVQIFYKFEALG